MRKNLFRTILTVSGFLFLGSQALAEGDDLLRARASVGYSSYDLTMVGEGSTGPDATSLYLVAGVGVTYATGNMYVDGSFSQGLGATHDWPDFEGDFERSDMALTAGYLLDNGWSVFGGYKSGKSVFYRDNNPGYRLTFEAYGPFGGASKAIGLDNGSSISFSGALAFMTGDIYNTSTLNDSGDAMGLSFSASYNHPLSQTSGLRARSFYQYYGFTDFSAVGDVDESILGIEAAYYLNF